MTTQQQSARETELESLEEVNTRPWPRRLLGYGRLSGPGWIQGAITLGASTATTSFYLGWQFGYRMLWVNILGMLMGVVMFAAIARPVLYREESMPNCSRLANAARGPAALRLVSSVNIPGWYVPV